MSRGLKRDPSAVVVSLAYRCPSCGCTFRPVGVRRGMSTPTVQRTCCKCGEVWQIDTCCKYEDHGVRIDEGTLIFLGHTQ